MQSPHAKVYILKMLQAEIYRKSPCVQDRLFEFYTKCLLCASAENDIYIFLPSFLKAFEYVRILQKL